MMRTLTRRRGLDWDDLVREHIAEWQRSTIGWGGTQYAVHRLSTGMRLSAIRSSFFEVHEIHFQESIAFIRAVTKLQLAMES